MYGLRKFTFLNLEKFRVMNNEGTKQGYIAYNSIRALYAALHLHIKLNMDFMLPSQ